MIESIRGSHVVLAPSSKHVLSKFLRKFELLILGQTSSEGILQNFIASFVHMGASAVRRRFGFQALQIGMHILRSIKRGEIPDNYSFREIGFVQSNNKGGQGADIG